MIPSVRSETSKKNHETSVDRGVWVVHVLLDFFHSHCFAAHIISDEIPVVKWAGCIKISASKKTCTSINAVGEIRERSECSVGVVERLVIEFDIDKSTTSR
jgi:hypothetical protein